MYTFKAIYQLLEEPNLKIRICGKRGGGGVRRTGPNLYLDLPMLPVMFLMPTYSCMKFLLNPLLKK